MLRALSLVLLAATAHAACPTAGGYSNTCFVSLSGSDSNSGTITQPFLTLAAATAIMSPGDTVMMRGGRYTNLQTADTNRGCTASQPCTIRAFPGEVVIIDGRSWGNNAFIGAGFGSYTQEPPYANDPKVSHWRIIGLRIEQVQRYPLWFQSQNDGLHFKSLRITGPQGIRLSSCAGCRLHAVYVDVRGVSQADGANGPAFDCTPVLPGNTQVPWMSTAYDAAGKPGTTPHYYQRANVTPRFPAIAAYGCRDMQVMDSHFEKEVSSATDTFGLEYGRDVHVERTRFIAPWAYGHEGNYGGSTGGTDAFDMKATGITVKDVEARGGKATMKLWGKVNLVQNTLVVHSEDGGESGVSLAGQLGLASSSWPPSTTYNTINFAGNTPDGDAYVVMAGGGPAGNSPVDGTHVEISNVPGCTSINKEVRIKSSVENKHVIFVLENTDGSQLSCNAAYDLSQLTQRTQERTFTTPGSTTDLTASSAPSFGTYGQFINGRVFFSSTGTLPSPLQAATPYYVVYLSGATFRVASAPGAASSAITLTTTGSGTHTATFYDDYASYAGEMRVPTSAAGRATWGAVIRQMTAISSRGTAMYGCTNCGSSDYSARKFTYSVQDSIVFSPRLQTIAAPIANFGGPRAIFSGSTVYLSEHLSGPLTVGKRVSFRTSGVLPTQLTAGTSYYIVASDNGARTIQISATSGGSAITFSGGAGRHWLVSGEWSSANVEITSTTNLAAGNTVSIRTTGTLPYPLSTSGTYTIDSVSTVSVNGTSVYLAALSQGGSPVNVSGPGLGLHKLYRQGVANNSGTRNYDVGGYLERLNAARNTYWSGAGTGTAYCGKVEGDPNFTPSNTCSTVSEVPTLESGSVIENPSLDTSTGRATASTPSTTASRGYAMSAALIGRSSTSLVVRYRAPSATETCAVIADDSSDYASPVDTVMDSQPGRWRTVSLGRGTALSSSTLYYWRVTCGYDVAIGTGTTLSASPGSAAITMTLTPAQGDQAAIDYRAPGQSWTAGSPVACGMGCSVSTPSLARTTDYDVRLRRLNSGVDVVIGSQEIATP